MIVLSNVTAQPNFHHALIVNLFLLMRNEYNVLRSTGAAPDRSTSRLLRGVVV